MKVAPSILSCDFGNLEQEVLDICQAGSDFIHVDVMDGHFVPNITMGPVIVSEIAKHSTKPLDIHLMVENNDFFVDLFAPLSPEFISFHIESEKHAHRLIQKIRSLGIRPAIALNPQTPVEAIKYLIKEVDMVLVMSVNPGFGGQKFIDSAIEKINELSILVELENPDCLIEVDGGVNDKNINLLKKAGANVVVAGSYVFYHKEGYEKAIESLKK